MKKREALRTWVEISEQAIESNAGTLRSLLADEISMMAIVKSNAYGHGMVASAKAALRGGADWLGVDEITEAMELRKARIKAPILVLGYTLPEYYKLAAQNSISLTISSLESLQSLSKMRFPRKLRVHLKFDTGLHRQGILESHVQQMIRLISVRNFPAVIEGAYTHFAVMEDPMRAEFSKLQTDVFRSIVAKLNAKGFTPITHASASSGILYSKKFHFDMSRAGIALYGLWPSKEIRLWAKEVNIVPALTWKTIVTEVKLIPRGEKVGYDLTHETERNSRIAIIPVGYWHGMPRRLSNRGEVLVNGKRAKIVGRVSMDMTIIDVTDIASVQQGDEVVIIGSQGKETISAEGFASWDETINYESVTRINPLIPRLKA